MREANAPRRGSVTARASNWWIKSVTYFASDRGGRLSTLKPRIDKPLSWASVIRANSA